MNVDGHRIFFKNHVAKLTDYGNIKILDFANPDNIEYQIRFIFDEDFCKLYISGDLGHLIATNVSNMRYEEFSDFVNNTGYFESKVDCHDRMFYTYDCDKAKEELMEKLREADLKTDCSWQTDEEYRESIADKLIDDLDPKTGLGSAAYSLLDEMDIKCNNWIENIGKEETSILDVYMLAFKLAQEQLTKQKDKEG